MRKFIFSTAVLFVVCITAHQAWSATTIEAKISLDFTKCENLTKGSSFTYDKACIETYYDNHPMTYTSFPAWQEVIKKPVNERLVVATEEMLEYMRVDNMLWDFPYENVSAATDPKLIAAAQSALAGLPPALNKYIDEHFYGFMIVSGVGWTGFASSIRVSNGNSLKAGAVIIINADNIKDRTLNEWLAFREKTTFDFFESERSDYELKMQYEKKGVKSTLEDNLRHFLIHETAHLIANADPSVHPAFKYRNKPVPFSEFEKWTPVGQDLTEAYPFLTASWLFTEGKTADGTEPAFVLSRDVSKGMNKIFENKTIKFYSTDLKSKFTVQEAKTIYNDLNKSCFPSLYGMVDYAEDFAETATHYFMSEVEGYKYRVSLYKKVKTGGGKEKLKLIAHFNDRSWKKSACKEKADFMRELFK